MDSQPSGNKYTELLSIETTKLYFTIKGKRKEMQEDYLKNDYKGFAYKCYPTDALISEGTYINCPYLYEYENYEITIENKGTHNIEFHHESKNIRDQITPSGRSGRFLSGIINFRGDIGFSDITIIVDGSLHLSITLEVLPSKLDYKKDYYEILKDVNEEIYNLSFEFLKRTYLGTKLTDKKHSSLTEYYSILNMVYENMLKALRVIINNPHHLLEKEKTLTKFHKLKNADNDMIKWLEKRPDKLVNKNGKLMPLEAMSVKKTITLDTNENRYLKYMLQSIIIKLTELKKKYKGYDRAKDNDFILTIDKNINELNSIINRSFLRNVSKFDFKRSYSLVFNMAPGYREVYKYYLMLQKGLTLRGEVFRLSMKELSELYEYWCFIKINSLLRKKYKLISSDFIKIDRRGIFVTLEKGKSSKVTYENPINGEKFTIAYNKSVSSKTIGQKPDNILSINKDGSKVDYNYIFDAKYKIDKAYEETYYGKAYKTPGPKEEDINTIHRYRDAIVYANKQKNNSVEKSIFGAFVLFPYNNEEEYSQHKFYKSIEEVNIGGIPFLPSATTLMEEFLNELIDESCLSSFERVLEQSGRDYYLKDSNFNDRNVLVGSLRNSNQLQVNLEHKFYHTSLTNVDLDKHSIKTIALAQSKKAFKGDAGVKYYGKVKDIKIVKRCDIKEIPKNSEELYVRFEVEEWKTLNNKIKVKNYQVRKLLYTTEYLLQNSEIVSELCIKSKEQFRIWRELKNLQAEVTALMDSDEFIENETAIKGFSVGDKQVIVTKDMIKVVCEEGIREFSLEEFKKKPWRVVKGICEK